MIDPTSSAYFDDRERAMRAAGLDPDDDDTWALPDYDLDAVIDEPDFYFSSLEPYDSTLSNLCMDCFDAPAEPRSENVSSGLLCFMCAADWERRNPQFPHVKKARSYLIG